MKLLFYFQLQQYRCWVCDWFWIKEQSCAWLLWSLSCSDVRCATGWSKKAVNEARPWWRRDSSSWKWVSGVDSLYTIHSCDSLTGDAWCLTRTVSFLPLSNSNVPSRKPFGYICVSFIWFFFKPEALFYAFSHPCRSSKLRCNQTVDLQDGLQAPVCAEEMQP